MSTNMEEPKKGFGKDEPKDARNVGAAPPKQKAPKVKKGYVPKPGLNG